MSKANHSGRNKSKPVTLYTIKNDNRPIQVAHNKDQPKSVKTNLTRGKRQLESSKTMPLRQERKKERETFHHIYVASKGANREREYCFPHHHFFSWELMIFQKWQHTGTYLSLLRDTLTIESYPETSPLSRAPYRLGA